MNENWEKDEFKALNDFCSAHCLNYEVITIFIHYQTEWPLS